MCSKQFDCKKSLEDHIDKDHNNRGLHVSLNSNNDTNTRLKQDQGAKCDDGDSDVSINEARMEALDREMNPGDFM